jgi:rod shape-determining protein MreD
MMRCKKLLDGFYVMVIPTMLLACSIIITSLPFDLRNIFLLMPFISHIIIYYYFISSSNNLPYINIFLLGLFKDILEGSMIGLNALSFLILVVVVRSQKHIIINKSFIVLWAGFLFCLSVSILPYIIVSQVYVESYNDKNLIIFTKWIITISLYSPLHYLLKKLKL